MDLHTITAMHRPAARADLAAALASPGAAVLAGGTWLYSEPQEHLHTLVDVNTLGWPPLARTASGLTIAATCTLNDLVAGGVPLARECCGALAASFKIWHTATVGGNVCLALPAGSMTALAVALDGIALIWTPDGRDRRLPVAELVSGVRRTTLAPGEVLRAIDIPASALAAPTAFRRVALSAQGRSGSVVIGRRDADGFVLTVTAAVERPHRFDFATRPTAAQLRGALDTIARWYDDPHGAPDWRRHVTGLIAEQVRVELA